jgi:hypothetical protein
VRVLLRLIESVEDEWELHPLELLGDNGVHRVYLIVHHLEAALVVVGLQTAEDHKASRWLRKIFDDGVLLYRLGDLLQLRLLAGRLGDEAFEKLALVELVLDGVAVILVRRIHQLLKVIAIIFVACLGRVIRGGNLIFAAPDFVAPLTLVGVFSTLFLHAARVADVMWGLPLVEDFSHRIFSCQRTWS